MGGDVESLGTFARLIESVRQCRPKAVARLEPNWLWDARCSVSGRPTTQPVTLRRAHRLIRYGRIRCLDSGGCPWARWHPPDQAAPHRRGNPDLAVVDWLARLQRTARRAGGRIRLEEACPALVDLLDLVGLRREVGGQAEGGKEAFGVEEGVDRRDATP